jgi:pimeloyl-ACP methyl ester carboxylesterase
MICNLLPDYFFSFQGFFDIANPDGDYNTFPFIEEIKSVTLSTKPLFSYFKGIKKPSLVIYGSEDIYQFSGVERVVSILKREQPKFAYQVIQNANHGITEHQSEFAKIVVNWLTSHKAL